VCGDSDLISDDVAIFLLGPLSSTTPFFVSELSLGAGDGDTETVDENVALFTSSVNVCSESPAEPRLFLLGCSAVTEGFLT
jgi:hypothetical protein